MIKIRGVVALAALMMAGACARADAEPAVTPVPSGCEPTAETLTWSAVTTTPVLTQVTLFRADELASGGAGRRLLDKPFTPSVTGVDAPGWLTALGASLARKTGRPVHTTAPSAEGQSFGYGSGAGPADVVYTGVDRVTADFEVRCGTTVRGRLQGWSRTVAGGQSCAGDITTDVFGRLAVQLCPAQPSPPAG
ncbi:hypothetical protein ACGFJ7_18860 [Actinoplanes sp. NPDC048988]|uniref:hypothetical protein n=1 Tax=Actinoplanes sp. NPDC048988 TaxID=3363901 RepID=UPI003717D495